MAAVRAANLAAQAQAIQTASAPPPTKNSSPTTTAEQKPLALVSCEQRAPAPPASEQKPLASVPCEKRTSTPVSTEQKPLTPVQPPKPQRGCPIFYLFLFVLHSIGTL